MSSRPYYLDRVVNFAFLSREASDLPLDLSVKSSNANLTPPSTPSPRKGSFSPPILQQRQRPHHHQRDLLLFGEKSEECASSPPKKRKKHQTKSGKKLHLDEVKSSPVSGTIIKDRSEVTIVQTGDIDPAYNVVEVTEEAKAELAKIPNKIGDYVCRLCEQMFKDAFDLAQHRCSCIVHVEYKCPECDKIFNCPANLASHRRWHKPKQKTPDNNKFRFSPGRRRDDEDDKRFHEEIFSPDRFYDKSPFSDNFPPDQQFFDTKPPFTDNKKFPSDKGNLSDKNFTTTGGKKFPDNEFFDENFRDDEFPKKMRPFADVFETLPCPMCGLILRDRNRFGEHLLSHRTGEDVFAFPFAFRRGIAAD